MDRLLAQARWDQPSAASTERLRRNWLALRSGRRLWIGLGLSTAAAALLLVIASVAIRSQSRVSELKSVVNTATHADADRVVVAWRDPTLSERLVLAPTPRRSSLRSTSSTPAATRPPERPSFYDVLESMADQDSDETLAHSAKSLLEMSSGNELQLRLIDAARHGSPRQRLAAVRLLARFGNRDARGVVVEAVAVPSLHDAAMPGVIRLSNADELAQFARQGTGHVARQQALAELVRRNDQRCVDLYLAFVLDPVMRDDALASLGQIDASSAAGLLAALGHPRVDYRFAAAKALGSLCPHGLAPELERMVERDINRREALAALLCCEDRAAADYLAAASRHQPGIASQITVVKLELQRLF